VITEPVRQCAVKLAGAGEVPAFVYDLGALRAHAAGIRAALSVPGAPEIFYAAKANPDPRLLTTLAPFVDGIEVASGGELEHVRAVLPDARLAFGGPGKTNGELALAVREAERIHVESPYELTRLADVARANDREVDVLLRVNLAGDRRGVALAMSGPFGMAPEAIEACHDILAGAPWIRLRGIHAHLASGLDAAAMLRQSAEILEWARPWLSKVGRTETPEFNLGGGMTVDYTEPANLFDWATYGRQIAMLALDGETLRIEPGRAVSVYSGWYVTQVLDVKKAHGRWYAVLRGGTQQIRTPVTKNHNQPFTVIPQGGQGPAMCGEPVTLVGQLCTPKDVFAREVPVERLAVGDVVAFSMAGAYAWNISHHDFLMHPKPGFHYVNETAI
jgi:diaminopimelate decarboxylase